MSVTEVFVKKSDGSTEAKTVDGTQVGPLFVHRTCWLIPKRRPGWTITHIRSGFAMITLLPTRQFAIDIASRLAELDGVDCDLDAWKSNESLQREVLRIFRESGILLKKGSVALVVRRTQA